MSIPEFSYDDLVMWSVTGVSVAFPIRVILCHGRRTICALIQLGWGIQTSLMIGYSAKIKLFRVFREKSTRYLKVGQTWATDFSS